MIISMTGFGRGEAADNGTTATVEIKSLNSRYLDVSIRLPQLFQDKELVMKDALQKEINRGKLNVNVHLTDDQEDERSIVIDEEKIQENVRSLMRIAEISGIKEAVQLRDVLNFGDIFTKPDEEEGSSDAKWKLVIEACHLAVANLMQMRKQEGEQLKHDLEERIQFIQDTLALIETATTNRIPEIRDRLMERIKLLIEDENLDPERLELEVAVLADKMDITEEIVRLRAHLKFFLEAIASNEPAGRRLNFLTQEINRELNTIGSKANDSEIAHHVVRCKESLEQIREQVQNVE
ncbi:MAG: YicC/YloC family endoribonuclease [Bacteroidota bacterium]